MTNDSAKGIIPIAAALRGEGLITKYIREEREKKYTQELLEDAERSLRPEVHSDLELPLKNTILSDHA
jgi:hypothetical protein